MYAYALPLIDFKRKVSRGFECPFSSNCSQMLSLVPQLDSELLSPTLAYTSCLHMMSSLKSSYILLCDKPMHFLHAIIIVEVVFL